MEKSKVSNCCGAEIRTEDFAGERFDYCRACEKHCDAVIKEEKSNNMNFADQFALNFYGDDACDQANRNVLAGALRTYMVGMGEKIGLEALKLYDDTKGRGEVAYIQQCVMEAFNKEFGI